MASPTALYPHDLDVLRALAARWPTRPCPRLWPVHKGSLYRLTCDRVGGPLAVRSVDGLRLVITDAGQHFLRKLDP